MYKPFKKGITYQQRRLERGNQRLLVLISVQQGERPFRIKLDRPDYKTTFRFDPVQREPYTQGVDEIDGYVHGIGIHRG